MFFVSQPLGLFFRDQERVFQRRLDEGAPLDLHDRHFSLGRFLHDAAVSRRAFGVVDWAQHARFGVQPRSQFHLVPDMVSGGDDVHSGLEQLLRQPCLLYTSRCV